MKIDYREILREQMYHQDVLSAAMQIFLNTIERGNLRVIVPAYVSRDRFIQDVELELKRLKELLQRGEHGEQRITRTRQ